MVAEQQQIIITSQASLKELLGEVLKELLPIIPFNFPSKKEEKEFFTTKEAAVFLNIAVSTLYFLNSSKEISYIRKGKKCYYLKEDLMNFLKDGRIKSIKELQNEADNSYRKKR